MYNRIFYTLNNVRKKRDYFVKKNFITYVKKNLLFTALFAAVEHGHIDKARTILESTDVDVNR